MTPDEPARPLRRRSATRARLLDAALGVFAEVGPGRATIEAVCEAAGYTRGAFYSNFSTLDELFLALAERQVAAVAAQVGEQVGAALAAAPPGSSPSAGSSAGSSAGTDVPAVVDRVLAALGVDRAWTLVRAEAALRAARDAEFADAWRAQRRAATEALARALAPATRALALPAPLDDPARLAEAVQAVHDGVVLDLAGVEGVDVARARLRELLVVLLAR